MPIDVHKLGAKGPYFFKENKNHQMRGSKNCTYMGKFRNGQSLKTTYYLGMHVIGVAAAIASLSIFLKVGISPSIADNVLARPELVAI